MQEASADEAASAQWWRLLQKRTRLYTYSRHPMAPLNHNERLSQIGYGGFLHFGMSWVWDFSSLGIFGLLEFGILDFWIFSLFGSLGFHVSMIDTRLTNIA